MAQEQTVIATYSTQDERADLLRIWQDAGYELKHDDHLPSGERRLTFELPAPRGEPTADEIEFTRVQTLIAALDGRNLTNGEINEVLRYTLKRVVS